MTLIGAILLRNLSPVASVERVSTTRAPAASAPVDLFAEPVTAPIPVLDGRRGWRETFSALSAHNYRLYVSSMMLANVGGWMARIAIDWLVFELTGDVAMVGLVVALQFAPTLLLGPWAGVIADRFSRRRTLMITQSIGTIANSVLAALVLTGYCELWHVLTVALITGTSMAIDGPSRSAFVSEMVGTHRLRNAISLNAAVFHFSGLVGPALSGMLIVVVGSGWSIAVNATASLIAVVALAFMRPGELVRMPGARRGRGQIREALRYAIGKPTILWPLLMLAVVAVFGMNLPVLFTASADETYGTGATGYGLYSSLAALGALIGAVLSTRRRVLRLRTIVLATMLYGAVTAFAGIAPTYGLFLGAVVAIGISRLTFATAAESLTQLSTNMAIRGRVMSFYLMTVTGGQALGGLIIGSIAETAGVTTAFLVAGGAPLLAGTIACVALARSRRLRLVVRSRRIRVVPMGALEP